MTIAAHGNSVFFLNHCLPCPSRVIAEAQDALRLPEEGQEPGNLIPGAGLNVVDESGPLEHPKKLVLIVLRWLDSLTGKKEAFSICALRPKAVNFALFRLPSQSAGQQ